ncbi:hypothetical protein FE257_008388, partial [Aspergillus nanangensis]
RGRPPKYSSAQEQQAAKIHEQRAKRRTAQAIKRATVFDDFYSAGPSITSNPTITHTTSTEEPWVTQKLEELLPPLSPCPAPLENKDYDLEIDGPPLALDSPRDTSPGPHTPVLSSPPTRSEPPLNNIEIRVPSPLVIEPREDICSLARILADQLYQHQGCCDQ